MKVLRITAVVFTVTVLAIGYMSVEAKGPGGRGGKDGILFQGGKKQGLHNGERLFTRMSETLDNAGVPLTDAQLDDLKEIEPGPGAREKVNEILTDNQETVLKEQFQVKAREQMFERMKTILDDAGVPLTDSQIADIEAIEPGPESRGEVHDILTDEQHDALKEAMAQHRRNNRGKRNGRGVGDNAGQASHPRGNPLERMQKTLSQAGVPLTDGQIADIEAIEHGPKSRGAVHDILTDEQHEALRSAMREAMFEYFSNTLSEAGVPLTDSQIAAIEAIEYGPESRGAVRDILTAEQRDALRDAWKKRRGGRGMEGADSFEGDDSFSKATDVDSDTEEDFVLKGRNFPNPFNPTTTIQYTLADPGHVRVAVYAANGQLIEELVDSDQSAGVHAVNWNAGELAAGIYFYTIETPQHRETHKMSFVK